MKWIVITLLSCICSKVMAQNIDAKLTAAVKSLESDAQFKHAILSLYVVDTKTGKIVFDKNAQVGLAPASCQKVVTSVSAFEMLGKEYKYKTEIGYDGNVKDSVLNGNLIFIGSGDPTLGSERYAKYANFYSQEMFEKVRLFPIKKITGQVYADDSKFEYQQVPKGWIWEDIGNYYGAGCGAINWKENAYPLPLRSGKNIGDSVEIISQAPVNYVSFLNNLKTAAAGTGDNSFIRLSPYSDVGSLEGTIPINEKQFIIKGSIPSPTDYFLEQLNIYFDYHRISKDFKLFNSYYGEKMYGDTLKYKFKKIYTNFSPPIDSINYWFLKKSINLYGEAFVKTIAYEKIKFGSTDSGIAIIKNFWKQKGIEPSALNIMDGSGLSPANRVTTNALVTVMQYAKQQKWFASFYNALPEMNGIKMKDGYISGVRSYTGYIKSKTGNEYTFSFIVNNFDGSPATVREKMWKVLDILK
jgi:serine-type D-Ala-D-Ala carboxypeptidase/endopeptidase (penicillin-binding protein 4)